MSDPDPQPDSPGQPRQQLSLLDSTSIIVGIIIGSGIYQSSPTIATGAGRLAQWLAPLLGLTASDRQDALAIAILIAIWIVGALIALVGAACYAELATAFPQSGGTYVYLSEAFGRSVGFAFVWAEFWIVRPGNIGAMAFVMARYARQLLPPIELADHRLEMLLAVAAILVMCGLNAIGLRSGKWTQNVLSGAKVLGLVAIIVAGISLANQPSTAAIPAETWKTAGLSLILVMFAYGGWADMSLVAAEVRDPRRNITRALFLGIFAVAVIYLSITFAFLHALGFRGLAASEAVAAEVMQMRLGSGGATIISLLVVVSCLGAMNGTIFTGARVYYALGTHHPAFRWLGRWDATRGIPLRALIAQAIATLALTIAVGYFPEGFDRLVVFTTPFFFGFTVLVGVALFVLRSRIVRAESSYRVPFYPLTPVLFILSSGAMVYASVDYAIRKPAPEVWWAAAVVATGLAAGLFDWRQRRAVAPKSPTTPAR
jgi:APA family basic amino acid/polyamine antiporter